jgi:3-keto-5-aminohexanoate cleavage enzyme
VKPLIICAAPTGGSPAKSKTPHHPVTPKQVVDEALACWRAGAAMIHLHARLEDGSTIMEVGAYREIVDKIEAAGCDAIINLSAGDDGGKADHKMRLSIADTGVEMVSLDAGPINIGNRIYNNSIAYLEEMAGRMIKKNITPEVEIFDVGHIAAIKNLIAKNLMKPPYYLQFVFGVPGGMPLDVRMLDLCLAHAPENTEWAISAQTSDPEEYVALQMQAFTRGGHVRCGMEDFVYLRPNELAKSNAQSVEQWTETAKIWGRPVASPSDARKILGIKH